MDFEVTTLSSAVLATIPLEAGNDFRWSRGKRNRLRSSIELTVMRFLLTVFDLKDFQLSCFAVDVTSQNVLITSFQLRTHFLEGSFVLGRQRTE